MAGVGDAPLTRRVTHRVSLRQRRSCLNLLPRRNMQIEKYPARLFMTVAVDVNQNLAVATAQHQAGGRCRRSLA